MKVSWLLEMALVGLCLSMGLEMFGAEWLAQMMKCLVMEMANW